MASVLPVPWAGLGPPGNGKTISIKATMHTLYSRPASIPTLYVRSLASFAGPEFSVAAIFLKARQEAPCYLVFEDLDSLVTDQVRSFFLNEVDGLQANDGILMVGSTNHIDRLDPGIAKRPSRFDRKYLFPDPSFDQRVQYCQYWQKKLSENNEVEFPDKLCPAIAKITDDFSFAYMQEAFVSALLSLAASKMTASYEQVETEDPQGAWDMVGKESSRMGGTVDEDEDEDEDLDKYILWRALRKQIKILRDELGGKE